MTAELEACLDIDELYVGRGRGGNPYRPIFTGDVFELPDGTHVMIAEHPCSMRAGVKLATTVLVAPVEVHAPLTDRQLLKGFYDLFPLPGIPDDNSFAVVQLNLLGRSEAHMLGADNRIACLLPLGVNLLQQRLVWYLTRCVVSTGDFEDAFARYYEEADLIEEWVELACEHGTDEESALIGAEEVLNEVVEGSQRLRDQLGDSQRRSFVRKRMRQAATERFAAQ